MNLEVKQNEVDALAGAFSKTPAVFLVGFQGTKCAALTSLRRKLHPSGAQFQVVKNTLAKRASKGTVAEKLEQHFRGPTAVIISGKDSVSSAKTITEFAKGVESFKIKAGVVEGSLVSPAEIEALAKMPSREELLGKLLAVMNAPAVRLLQTINAPAASLARVLGAWKGELEKKQ
jgi:large subunit ribosomal protein L10